MILRRISLAPEKAADAWYFAIPTIAALADEPLVLDAAVTVIVGENGSGKSTLLEAVAAAWGALSRSRQALGAQSRRGGQRPALGAAAGR
jgi:predicted ATPase